MRTQAINSISSGCFSRKVVLVYGSRGELWLKSLPALIDWCCIRWECIVQPPFELDGVNYVAPIVRRDGTEAVLKLSIPGKECENEISALRHYEGIGMCRLLDSDERRGALILERIGDGVDLRSIHDEHESVRIASSVIKAMRLSKQSPSYSFSEVGDWYVSLLKEKDRLSGSGLFSSEVVKQVAREFGRLIETQRDTYVLHGDFHHRNILRADGGWRSIDPKGVIGEVEYELIPFLMNELPDSDFQRVIDQRIHYFRDELGIDLDRTYGWGLCHSLLSCWWNIEDNDDVTPKDIAIVKHFGESV